MAITKFILPDIIGYCPFQLKVNPHMDTAAAESDEWMEKSGVLESTGMRKRYIGARFNYLSAACFPEANFDRFRLCCDYINALFAFDDVIDDGDLKEDIEGAKAAADIVMASLMNPKTCKPTFIAADMLRDFWERAVESATPGCRRRFIETMDLYVRAAYQQVVNRTTNDEPSIESFIQMRRDISALRPIWAVVEFALGVDLPDEVIEHPILQRLAIYANDLVSWCNDLYSFNCEQSRGHYSNLVPIAMKELDLDLQGGIDYVGDRIKAAIDSFVADKAALPSWGPEIDEQVRAYVRGMEYWVIGSIQWSFDSTRYFGSEHEEVKKTLCVTLWPQEHIPMPVSIQS
ncbi:hypothetical protein BOTBODRAFT_115253 [Botryobasidium botryosum FD-172 SS1]|uniref:Terpene synthase n=1 Tax=Botryobasidium botryosum (strain FD-172 SS1) TaxID=930990 RepID=A0A067M838_BOTB1|nr:hypothetical protein BOTBODRAFT_115253 [Botryobasidium botryosum FD-172 SS1]